jgi:glutathione S-transferase
MIKLQGFGPLWDLMDASPFVQKIDAYLRLAEIPHQVERFSVEEFRRAPKGKYPCIIDGDVRVADSNFIIEYLKEKFGDRLDANLTPAARAVGHAITRMLEENFYWVLVTERWRDTTAAVTQFPTFAGAPAPVVRAVQDNMLSELRGQGMGRHSADEVEKIGKADLIALSNIVDDKPFVLGQQPSSFDATVYAFVAHTIQPEYDSRMKHFIYSLPNLTGYWERLTSRLYRADRR